MHIQKWSNLIILYQNGIMPVIRFEVTEWLLLLTFNT